MSARRGSPGSSMLKMSTRSVPDAGLAACFAAAAACFAVAFSVLPALVTANAASASPNPSIDHVGGGGPGWGGPFGWGGSHYGHRYGAIVGTVVSAPGATAPTSFTMDVAASTGTITLVTVNVSTITTLDEPGTSSPSLSAILVGDQVQVRGTQDGTNTVSATSVALLPTNNGYGGHGRHRGRGGRGRGW